ncbi:MAG: hypothetical protein ACRCSF_04155 [Mycobacteriaceae bacterium]
MQNLACRECVISALLDAAPGSTCEDSENVSNKYDLILQDEEHRALEVLADAGLVPRLRLLPTVNSDPLLVEGEIKVQQAG